MIPLRSLFASALLAVVLVGGALAPAAHWAGHGLRGHDASHVELTDGQTAATPATDAGHTGECPDCAHLQTLHVTGPAAQPFYAGVVGLERSVPTPEAPAVQVDVATPEGRGPPTAA